jgi:hypothetical protein
MNVHFGVRYSLLIEKNLAFIVSLPPFGRPSALFIERRGFIVSATGGHVS